MNKLATHSYPIFWMVMLAFVGCSTSVSHVGSNDAHLTIGKRYLLQREAILLANRGLMDSVENPNYNLQNYKPYEDYHPYYIQPIGVLPKGTLIEVKEIRLYRRNQFLVIGEIKTGPYVRERLSVWRIIKGVIIGPWPRTGKVIMNKLCGGESIDYREIKRNLAEQVE
ncbi:MAG: hypothetical protein HY298_19205 [Verrucomicrobia bacterium]|nr:hypothetical protein [Verrucomicrobiota bacterium]